MIAGRLSIRADPVNIQAVSFPGDTGVSIFHVRHGKSRTWQFILIGGWWDSNPRPKKPWSCRRRHLLGPADDAICEGVVVPEGGRERTQGYQLRLETAPVLLIDFSLLALSYEKLEETGKEKEEKEEEEKEWEHGGGVKLTEFASPRHCCCALFWTFTYGTYKERSPRCSIFPWAPNALTSIYLVQRNVPLPRTLLWYKLARFYGLSAPLRIFRLRESSCSQ